MKKLVIKLKIPQGAQLLNCPTCRRSFKNAKALGGHKRVHMREANRNQLQIANLETRVVQERNFFCPVCNQGFSSARSVRGHMRKHPDRNWRGMNPPSPVLQGPNQENQQFMALEDGPHHQSEEEQEVGPGLLTLPSGWSRTGRRGRPGKAPAMNKKLASAADKLLVLGGGYSLGKIESKSSSIKGKEPMFVYNVPAVTAQNNKLYSCTICDKSFKSYRALGGHKSHHKIRSSCQESAVISSGAIVPYVAQPQCNTQIFSIGKHLKGLGFDLNELPPEWED